MAPLSPEQIPSGVPTNEGCKNVFEAPYQLFLGNVKEPTYAKTALGIRDWASEKTLAQYRRSSDTYSLGLPDMSFEEAVKKGAKSLIIGLATEGGQIEEAWREDILKALEAGLDIVSGMHSRLEEDQQIEEFARIQGRRLINIRHFDQKIPVASGKKRSGKRLLTVGTDCALGKKYTALTLQREMQESGMRATFRATGQTGIMIAGSGIPIDSVVSDFVAGAAEIVSPSNHPDHWDVIEGQGSLFHPAYAAVSVGLLHGSQPDALVICHDPLRETIDGYPAYPIPDMKDAIELNLALARLTNPDVRMLGVSLNTAGFEDDQRARVIAEFENSYGLPCTDPVAIGVGKFVKRLARF